MQGKVRVKEIVGGYHEVLIESEEYYRQAVEAIGSFLREEDKVAGDMVVDSWGGKFLSFVMGAAVAFGVGVKVFRR